jgi:hypothetical protein
MPLSFLERMCVLLLAKDILGCIYLFIYFVLLQFLWGLGLQEDEAECFDVYGLDLELLEMVPKPVLAVLFLYPLTSQVFSYVICLLLVFLDCGYLYSITISLSFCLVCIIRMYLSAYFDKSFSPQSEEERILQENEKKVRAMKL